MDLIVVQRELDSSSSSSWWYNNRPCRSAGDLGRSRGGAQPAHLCGFFCRIRFKKKGGHFVCLRERLLGRKKKSSEKRLLGELPPQQQRGNPPPQSPSSPKYLKQNKQRRRRRSKLSCCRLARFNKVWVRSRDDGSSGRSGGQSTSFDGYSRWDIRQWMVGWPATTAAAGRQSTVVSCEWWCWFTDRIGAP